MGRISFKSDWPSFRHQWWAVIVLLMIGALIGLGLHQLRPETYRASATLVVGIDFVRTASISETEIANIIGLVGDQVNSTSVIEETVQRARIEGIEVDSAGLRAAGRAIRQNHIWMIEIRHPDPAVSARLANLWVESAYEQLDSMMVHSVLVDNLAAAINAMQSCYELMPVLPAHAYCNPENLPNLQSMMLDMTRQLEAARLASGQIPSTASVSIGRRALTPLTPEEDFRNLYMFAGALLGLGSAVVLVGRTWAQPLI